MLDDAAPEGNSCPRRIAPGVLDDAGSEGGSSYAWSSTVGSSDGNGAALPSNYYGIGKRHRGVRQFPGLPYGRSKSLVDEVVFGGRSSAREPSQGERVPPGSVGSALASEAGSPRRSVSVASGDAEGMFHDSAGCRSWAVSRTGKRMVASEQGSESRGPSPEDVGFRSQRKRVPPGQVLQAPAVEQELDQWSAGSTGGEDHAQGLWDGRQGLASWAERPTRGRKRLSETDVFPDRNCVSEPTTPRAAASSFVPPRPEGIRTYHGLRLHTPGVGEALGNQAQAETSSAEFQKFFEGSAGDSSWHARPEGRGMLDELHTGQSVVFGKDAEGSESVEGGEGRAAFDGCAGLATWKRRDQFAHGKVLQQGLQTFMDQHGQPEEDVNTWTRSKKSYQKRQFPGAPVRKGVVDSMVFGHDLAAPGEGDKLENYTANFEGFAGDRTWHLPREEERFRRLGGAGRLTASSPELPLTGSTSTAAEPTAEATPRRRLCREASPGGDLSFSRKDEVVQDFKDVFSGSAGVASWAKRPQALVRNEPREAYEDPLTHEVRPAGSSTRSNCCSRSPAPAERVGRVARQASTQAHFHGAAGKTQSEINNRAVLYRMRGKQRPSPVLGGSAPWS